MSRTMPATPRRTRTIPNGAALKLAKPAEASDELRAAVCVALTAMADTVGTWQKWFEDLPPSLREMIGPDRALRCVVALDQLWHDLAPARPAMPDGSATELLAKVRRLAGG